MSTGDLAQFLRSRREATAPADVGLPAGVRRRTPGLRRSELATLAGISVDYLIRLEQGRDTHPSAQVLAAVAAALQLGEEDLGHLRRLAAISFGPELCPAATAPARVVRPTVQAMLERLEPAPAYVSNHLGDLLAWTDAFARLAEPLGLLDGDRPNLVWYAVVDPRARHAFPDWHDVVGAAVAELQAEVHPDDPAADALVHALTEAAGSVFTPLWDRGPVATPQYGERLLLHPQVGQLRIAFEAVGLPDAARQRLVVYLPADDATSAAFDQLSGRRPRNLRSVSAR